MVIVPVQVDLSVIAVRSTGTESIGKITKSRLYVLLNGIRVHN